MTDNKLYRSHSIEKSKNDNNEIITSGILTIWEDSPVSPFDVGDTFSPITNGPALTVEKVSIKDNVIGELNGKPFRQWEITIEGSNDTTNSKDSETHIKYNFNISADEMSGTMEVVNTGDNPSLSLSIGDSFSVPGIGDVYCSNVKGSDEYDDDGTHSWTVIYEGTNKQEALPETKYSFSIESDDKDKVIHSGSMQVVLEGDNPSFSLQPGAEFSLPGLGNVKCSKVTGNDEYDDSGRHIWTITYEGTDSTFTDELPNIKYSFSIEKDGDSDIHTGNMTVTNAGDKPSLTIATGESFSIPGIGSVTCTKVSGNDEYDDDGKHIWTVTYEGTDAPDEDNALPEIKYNFSIEENNSGSMSVVSEGDSPAFSIHVGDTFNVPGIGNLTCTKVSGNDDYTEAGSHRWTVVYEGSNEKNNDDDHDNVYVRYSFGINPNDDGAAVHSGTMEVSNSGEAPALSLALGDSFSIPGIGNVICTSVKGNDSYNDDGSHSWTVTYKGTDAAEDASDDEILPEIKYNFSIEGDNQNNITHSGTMQVVNSGDAPAFDFGIGHEINVPGIGKVKCTKINGSDEHTENGSHIWTVTYEGTDATEDTSDDEILPEIKYSFSIEGRNGNPEHTGSMQVVNSGDNPAFTIDVGSQFTIPGAGKVICTKVSGSDEYTENGTRLWTVTYEGSDKDETSEQEAPENTKYTFSAETSGDKIIHSGTKQVIAYGDAPAFTHKTGDTFNVPGAGNIICTKYSGADEFTDDGLHKWTILYEGTDSPDDDTQPETLPETKYNLAIEKDNDGDIQKSGSMSVVHTGDAPNLDVSVGSAFNIPGIGQVTCSKVTANDDYTDEGTHRWTMTYEGYVNSQSDDDDHEQDTNAKYTFSLEKDSSGNITHSGSVEITNAGNSPAFAHNVGDKLNLPGIGEVTCVKVSGSDSYTDTDKRKWTVIYEASDKLQEDNDDDESSNVKYSLSIENNSDGVTVYSGSKEIACSGETPSVSVNIGGKFSLPFVGELTCTKIHCSNDNDIWSVIIEGSRSGEASDDEDDSSLPENETAITYEINGSAARTVSGEFIALIRSQTPITKKNITVYSNSAEPVALPGSQYQGGIVTSENITHETIKTNGVITGSYYKHNIEVEA